VFWDTYINDSQKSNDYQGTVPQSSYPHGPYINKTRYQTWFYNSSDSFELKVNKLTLAITQMTKYNASVTNTTTFNTLVTTGGIDYCCFWTYPNIQAGETYKISHIGLVLEMFGDIDNFKNVAGATRYLIRGSRQYSAPGGGIGDTQQVMVARNESMPDKAGTLHTHILNLNSYVNEFLFDQDTGILLQYHRVYNVRPYPLISRYVFPGSNKSLSATNDMYDLDFTMTLSSGSNVDLGLSNTAVILLWVFIPVGIVAAIAIVFFIRRRY